MALDQRARIRRRRSQPGPRPRGAQVAQPGIHRLQVRTHRLDPGRRDRQAAGVDLRERRHPQLVSQRRVDRLLAQVRDAHARPHGARERQRQAVAADRPDRQRQPEGRGQGRGLRPGGQHERVGGQVGLPGPGGHEAPALEHQRLHAMAERRASAQALQAAHELAAQQVAIGDTFIGRPDAAGDGHGTRGQRGLDPVAIGGRQHLLAAAQRPLQLDLARLVRQAARVGAQHELAVGREREGPRLVAHPAVQHLAAQPGEAQQALGALAHARLAARAKKAQAPAPLARIRGEPEAHRRIARQEHPGQGPQRRRRGERLDVAVAQLGAVGEAGQRAGLGRRVHQQHVQAVARQLVGRRAADDAGADHADRLHRNRAPVTSAIAPPFRGWRRSAGSRRAR